MADDQGEEFANLQQRIAQLEQLVETMTLLRTDAGLNAASLEAAQQIEDLFAQGHLGGRTQRLARVQIVIREAIRTALAGGPAWDASVQNASVQNASVPMVGAPPPAPPPPAWVRKNG